MSELLQLLLVGVGLGAGYFGWQYFSQGAAARRKTKELKLKEDYKKQKKAIKDLQSMKKRFKGDSDALNKAISKYNSKYGTNIPTIGE